MTYSRVKFDQAICEIVSKIKPGQVMGYGEVARAAGYPRHARMVSRAMARSDRKLPWYRVVRSNRTLAFDVGSAAYLKQKSLLEKENVQVKNGKVLPCHFEQIIDMDKLLWGPAEED